MLGILWPIVMFLVIVALCMFIYNMVLAPVLGRSMPMMPLADLLFILIFIGIVIFALQTSGLWDKMMVMPK